MGGIQCQRADRLHRLIVKDRLVARTPILALPHTAARRTHVEDGATRGVLGADNRGNSAAHPRRADVSRRETGDRRGRVGCLLSVDLGSRKQSQGEYQRFAVKHTAHPIDQCLLGWAEGKANQASSVLALISALFTTSFCRSEDPLSPDSIEKGMRTPSIFS